MWKFNSRLNRSGVMIRSGVVLIAIVLVAGVLLSNVGAGYVLSLPNPPQCPLAGGKFLNLLLPCVSAPVQAGISGPDSANSFNATLPNGRRVTPAGVSVSVGENPLNAVLTPDGKFVVVTNDDERNTGSFSTNYSQDAVNGAGAVPGGYTLAVVRSADMQVASYAKAPANSIGNPGPKMPGKTQSDKTATLFFGVAARLNPANPGKYLVYASGGPSDLVNVYDMDGTGVLTLTTSISIPVPTDPKKPNYGMAAPGGLTLSPDGSRLYVVNNNANTVVTIDTATNQVIGQPVEVGYFPYAAVLSSDQSKLYVSNWGVADRNFNSTYQGSYNPQTGSGNGSPDIGGVLGNLFANPQTDANKTSSVSVLSLTGKGPSAISLARQIDGVNIVGGTHPSAMALVNGNGKSALYVTDANEDQLAIIDTQTDQLVGKVTLESPIPGLQKGAVLGLTPNALAVSPDMKRLFVAEAGLNAVSVYNVEDPFEPEFQGRIPTGWYPTGVTVSPDGSALYIVNAKGQGSPYLFQGAVPGSPDVNLLFGSVQKVDLTSLSLDNTTEQVRNNTYQYKNQQGNSILQQLQPKIKHIFFILRENKTYDTYFGDDAVLNARGANGKPEYANFGGQVPNTKALAEQFAIGDNVYADAEESDAGHSFALAAFSTDYQQKTLLSRFARPFINTKNEDPEDYPLMGYIFNHLARNETSYRNYGDLIRVSGYDDGGNPNPCADDPYPNCNPATYSYKNTISPTVGLGGLFSEDVPALKVLGDNHTDPNYPGWNLRISDQRRAREFIQDMQALVQAGTVPQFTFIWLPDDHTGGGLDPRWEVSDNDAALGQIVDYISHSSLWASSAIFITEDDAQASPDHVNAHRTYTMVISPYAKRGYVSHRLSSTVSIPKTVEELLNLPPMALNDLVANDLSDYFTTTPDLTPYVGLSQASVAQAPAVSMRIAALTAQLDNSSYDRDNARLGQLTDLFLKSLKVNGQKQKWGLAEYFAQQENYYRTALGIVGKRGVDLSD